MHIKIVEFKNFRRFTNLVIKDLPPTARLIVLAGPNGVGKSSVFDGFRNWQHFRGGVSGHPQDDYHHKQGVAKVDWGDSVKLLFHEEMPENDESLRKLFYIRSAYRNDPDFTVENLGRMKSPLLQRRVHRMIDNDASVGENYQRLVSQTLEGIYSGNHDASTVVQLRDSLIGKVRDSMRRVFGDLILAGPGDPLVNGSFFFEKGISKNFHYKNLSGGEKGAFDILLDFVVQIRYFDNTVFCIDEPETHLNARLQASLLGELLNLLPKNCQLWIATHAIGMMRCARDLHVRNPQEVVFLNFEGHDFDNPVSISPVIVNRKFWSGILNVALDDMANLVAPQQVVLCEGRPRGGEYSAKAEFDARCYRTIFSSEFPDVDFISVGNSTDVCSDRMEIGKAIQTISGGTKITRVIDRDGRSPTEIQDAFAQGIRVLSRRHLESYLADDEILTALCHAEGRPELAVVVLKAKQDAISESEGRGNPRDDIKSASGKIFTECRKILGLNSSGNTTDAFFRDSLAPLVTSGTKTYSELRKDIFLL